MEKRNISISLAALTISLFSVSCLGNSSQVSPTLTLTLTESPMVSTPSVSLTLSATRTPSLTVVPSTLTPTATSTASHTATATLTPSELPSLDRSLLINYNPPAREFNSDIWIIKPEDKIVSPLHVHTNDYAYCCPKWSPDGEWIAYVRTSITESVSGLWVSRDDGSDKHQIGDDIYKSQFPPGVQTIIPIGWSSDGQKILYTPGDSYFMVDIGTGTTELFNQDRAQGGRYAYNPTTNEFLLGRDDAQGPTFRIVNFFDMSNIWVVRPPESYQSIDGLDFPPIWKKEVSLSPDGKYLVIAGYSITDQGDMVQLWLVDVREDEWELIKSSSSPTFFYTSLSWSSDGQWVAWWDSYRNIDSKYSIQVVFLSRDTWEITRPYEISFKKFALKVIGWTLDTQKRSRFAIFDARPGRGIFLLKPDGNESNDLQLISIERMNEVLPFSTEKISSWEWQP